MFKKTLIATTVAIVLVFSMTTASANSQIEKKKDTTLAVKFVKTLTEVNNIHVLTAIELSASRHNLPTDWLKKSYSQSAGNIKAE